jgi:hypothetical protein
MCHNEIKDELCDLLSKALVPSAVHNQPIIYPYYPTAPTHAKEPDPVRYINLLVDNDHRDILVHNFWACGTDCIINQYQISTPQGSSQGSSTAQMWEETQMIRPWRQPTNFLKEWGNFLHLGTIQHPLRKMAPAILGCLWLCQILYEYCHWPRPHTSVSKVQG